MEKLPLVSIIVPVYNDEDTIEVCLRTLIRQIYPMKEIIVVNDGSTDNTANVLSRVAREHPSLRVVSIEHSGIAKARNVGLKRARGSVVFFGEGDAIYSRDYLTKAVGLLMKNPKLGGVCLLGAPWVVKSTFVTECIDVENRIKHKLLKVGRMQPYYAWVYRKKAVDAVDGCDERLFQAEDKDLFERVKNAEYSIELVAGVNWRHKRDQDAWTYTKRCYVGGKTRIIYLIKYRKAIEFFQSVGLFWFLALALVSVPFIPLLSYAVLFVFSLLAVHKLFFTLRFGWSCVKRKRYLFFIPLFSALRYMTSAVGYTHSLVIVFIRKLERKPIDWSSM